MAIFHAEWDTISSQLSDVAEQTGKSVVAVHGGRRVAGSGIIWHSGIIVTASHMMRRTEDVEVTIADQSRHRASFLGRDPGTDVAVFRFDQTSAAPPAQLRGGSGLRVGQLILAVGRSTLGDLAASAGIIARLGGPWHSWRGGKVDTLVRSDVTLHIGQSGGALVDSGGRVIGMNTSALARAAAITIPSATVDRVVAEITEHGGVFRPYLGLAMQPVALPEDLRSKLQIDGESALMVMQVEPESPGADAGIMLGDLIVSVNHRPVGGIEQVQRALHGSKRGDSIELGYARGGQLLSAKVKLADRPRR
jgi:S1-C subfamily serine protease